MVRNWVPFQEPVTFRSLLLDYIDAAGGGLYWALDDTDLATDLSGNGHDGTASGPTIGGHTATFPPIDGEDPSCTDFDGTDDYISSTYDPFTNGTVRTYLCWFYAQENDGYILGTVGGNNFAIRMSGGPSNLAPDLFANGSLVGDGDFMGVGQDVWIFFALVYDETTDSKEVYVNGALSDEDTAAGSYGTGAGTFGAAVVNGFGGQWPGKQGHVAVVEGGLTAQQIQDLYWTAQTGLAPISGLQGWWKADALALADNATVTSWTDSSGNARHLDTGGAPTFQTNELNGLPIVRFDGTDDKLYNASSISPKHFFAVVKITQATFPDYDGFITNDETGGGAESDVGLGGDGAGGLTKFYNSSTETTLYRLDQTDLAEGSMTAPMNTYGVISFSCAAGWTWTGIQLCSDRGNGRYLPADVAEVIVYDSVLSSTDRDAVEAYLADKWGL
jgi:hypothetical protein